jgi:uridine kinase
VDGEDPELGALVERVLSVRAGVPSSRSVLVALTGIDASGKGFVAAELCRRLESSGLRAGVIGVDRWLELPRVRFARREPGAHFYRHALRFEALFRELVLPLRAARSIRVEADQVTETGTRFQRETIEHRDLDVILLEGIFLLKRELQDGRYDLAVWIECSFETALERALARRQEGLSPAETIHAYRTIYFPAQALHLERDDPRAAADLVLVNDGASFARGLQSHSPAGSESPSALSSQSLSS